MGSKQKNSPEKTLTAPGAAKAALRNAEPEPSKIHKLTQYFEDAKKELGKVSWPTRKEVKATTLAVLALVGVMSIFLAIVDLILAKIVESILSIGV